MRLFLVARFAVTVVQVVVALTAGFPNTSRRTLVVMVAPVHHAVLVSIQLLTAWAVRHADVAIFGVATVALAVFKVVVALSRMFSRRMIWANKVCEAPFLHTVATSIHVPTARANTTIVFTAFSIFGKPRSTLTVIKGIIALSTLDSRRVVRAMKAGVTPTGHAVSAGIHFGAVRAGKDTNIAALEVAIVAFAVTECVVALLTQDSGGMRRTGEIGLFRAIGDNTVVCTIKRSVDVAFFALTVGERAVAALSVLALRIARANEVVLTANIYAVSRGIQLFSGWATGAIGAWHTDFVKVVPVVSKITLTVLK